MKVRHLIFLNTIGVLGLSVTVVVLASWVRSLSIDLELLAGVVVRQELTYQHHILEAHADHEPIFDALRELQVRQRYLMNYKSLGMTARTALASELYRLKIMRSD